MSDKLFNNIYIFIYKNSIYYFLTIFKLIKFYDYLNITLN